MKGDKYIRSYCSIQNNTAFLNSEVFYRGESKCDPEEFFKSTYKTIEPDYPKFYKMDALSKLGFLSVEILLNKGSFLDHHLSKNIAIVLANSSSSLNTDRLYIEKTNCEESFNPSPSLFVYTLPNIVSGEICIRNKIRGENVFFIMPSFNSELFYSYVEDLFNNSGITACICGWAELLEDTYSSFFCLIDGQKQKDEISDNIVFSSVNLNKLYINNDDRFD